MEAVVCIAKKSDQSIRTQPNCGHYMLFCIGTQKSLCMNMPIDSKSIIVVLRSTWLIHESAHAASSVAEMSKAGEIVPGTNRACMPSPAVPPISCQAHRLILDSLLSIVQT